MRAIRIVAILIYWLPGILAAVWWLPAFLSAEKPVPWQFGAVCLLMQWTLVFNHWPALGTYRFWHGGERYLKLELAVLAVASVAFLCGLAIVVLMPGIVASQR
jgi:hypothetical protein